MSNNELKPCPFCGADGVQLWTPEQKHILYKSDKYEVWCGNCDEVFTFDVPSEDVLIKCWNTRPIEDALHAEIADLHEQYGATCEKGHVMQLIRPGKYQCVACEEIDELKTRIDEITLEAHLQRKATREAYSTIDSMNIVMDRMQKEIDAWRKGYLILAEVITEQDGPQFVDALRRAEELRKPKTDETWDR